jgi:hypothetical protein
MDCSIENEDSRLFAYRVAFSKVVEGPLKPQNHFLLILGARGVQMFLGVGHVVRQPQERTQPTLRKENAPDRRNQVRTCTTEG